MKSTIRAQIVNNKAFFIQIREQIAQGRKVTIRAKGWSMLPFIWDDRDTLTLAQLREDSYKVGRIVFAQLGTGRYIVHRIDRIEGSRFVLRGDGNPYQEEYVHRDKILAELVSIGRKGRTLSPSSLAWKLQASLWPRHGFLRRLILFFYRRLVVRPAKRTARRVYMS